LLAETNQNAKPSEQEWHYDGNSVKSSAAIKRLMLVDQKPIGKNSRSTPASYLGVWDDIRKLYAQTSEARARGYQVGFFSYNTGKGRCQSCKGIGQIRHEMSFLADAWSICESCGGSRFTEDANSILYLGRSVSELLEMTFEEAKKLFSNHRRIQQILHYACDLGLGYLTLGQDSSTLSGGESQRIKLVSELSGNRKGHTIYLLDEPTTGLHKADVARLISTLRRLVDQGHSIIVIEHDPDFISQSDYVIELGPGPAEQGGKVIFEGPFLNLAGSETPWGRLLSSESWSSASNT
jgi:excinuclease ABC subunit A